MCKELGDHCDQSKSKKDRSAAFQTFALKEFISVPLSLIRVGKGSVEVKESSAAFLSVAFKSSILLSFELIGVKICEDLREGIWLPCERILL